MQIGTVWSRIIDFPDYAVSGEGQVMRVTPAQGTAPGRLLKPNFDTNGYPFVALCRGGKIVRRVSVHRLMAMHLLPNPENKPQVNHKDGVKAHNVLTNLEWSTSAENCQHAVDTGLRTAAKGEMNGRAKLSLEKAKAIRGLYASGESCVQIARKFGVTRQTIWHVCHRRSWNSVERF